MTFDLFLGWYTDGLGKLNVMDRPPFPAARREHLRGFPCQVCELTSSGGQSLLTLAISKSTSENERTCEGPICLLPHFTTFLHQPCRIAVVAHLLCIESPSNHRLDAGVYGPRNGGQRDRPRVASSVPCPAPRAHSMQDFLSPFLSIRLMHNSKLHPCRTSWGKAGGMQWERLEHSFGPITTLLHQPLRDTTHETTEKCAMQPESKIAFSAAGRRRHGGRMPRGLSSSTRSRG
jgi:hypothetical protein